MAEWGRVVVTLHARELVARLLTPPGAGAMAVVRVEGAGAVDLLKRIFRPRSGRCPDPTEPQRLWLGRIVDEGETIDDAVVAMHEFTPGVQCIDVTVHGGVRIVERLLMLCQKLGAVVPAGPSAVVSPRLDVEREIALALSRAQTRRAVRFIVRQSRLLPAALKEIARTAATDAVGAKAALRELVKRSAPGRYLVEGVTVAVVGPVNAGKSTLINATFEGARNLVSGQPGTTLDWVDTQAAIEGVPIRVLDTAGVRTESVGVESVAVERGRDRAARADVSVAVLDGSAPFPHDYVRGCPECNRRSPDLVVVNKSDLKQAWRAHEVGDWRCPVVSVSALQRQGIDRFTSALLAVLSIAETDREVAMLFTSGQLDWISGLLEGDNHQCLSGLIETAVQGDSHAKSAD